MNTRKWLVVTLCLVALCALVAPSAMMADQEDKASKLTFSEPVEVPGQVLPAGTYWFTMADSPSDRNIVQIWNADVGDDGSRDSRLPDATQGKNRDPFRGEALGSA